MPSATSAVASASLPATTSAWKRRSERPRVRPSASQRLIVGRGNVASTLGNPCAWLRRRLRDALGLGTGRIWAENHAIHRNAVADDGFDMRGLVVHANRG